MADSQEEAGFVPTMTRQLTAAADDPDVDSKGNLYGLILYSGWSIHCINLLLADAPMDQGGVSSPDSQSHLDYLWQIRLGGLTDPGMIDCSSLNNNDWIFSMLILGRQVFPGKQTKTITLYGTQEMEIHSSSQSLMGMVKNWELWQHK